MDTPAPRLCSVCSTEAPYRKRKCRNCGAKLPTVSPVEAMRAYRAKNMDRKRAWEKAWKAKNRDKVNAWARAGARARALRRIKETRPDDHQLARLLGFNAIYAAAHAAVPRGLAPDTRDDVISDIVLAVIEGTITVEAIPANVRQFVNQHMKAFADRKTISMDAVIVGTEKLRLHDVIADERGYSDV